MSHYVKIRENILFNVRLYFHFIYRKMIKRLDPSFRIINNVYV